MQSFALGGSGALEVLELDAAKRWTLLAAHEGNARVRAEPFAALELDLGSLWAF